jgi:hypothetical protein
MKRLLIKSLLLLLPLMIIMGYFVFADPMRCFREYRSPLLKGVTINDRIFQARWLEKHAVNYNAFILGSSRSKSFHTRDWAQHLDSATIFHMGVNDESLYGIMKKLEFLEHSHYRLKYVLLVMDHRILSRPENPEPHTFREYPAVSGETYAAFYQRFLYAFLRPAFLDAYFYRMKHLKGDPNYCFEVDFRYDSLTGDHFYDEYEDRLKGREEEFYQEQQKVFYDRSYVSTYHPEAVIGEASETELKTIQDVLQRNHTQYKLVITPNYDQKKLHSDDLKKICDIFGSANVYDFSGVNKFTCDIHNYYEERHFRPFIARQIMDSIYQKQQ